MATPRVDAGHEGGTARRPRHGAGARAKSPPATADVTVVAEEGAKPVGPPLDPVRFCTTAIAQNSVEAACKERGTTLEAYVAARLTDPAFDEAALRADQVMDLRVVDRVRQAAQEPNALAAQALYLKAVRIDAMQARFPSQRLRPGLDDVPTMAPDVAAAVIKAGLEAHEKAVLGGPPEDGSR